MTDDRPFCKECGLRSDIGDKCRECYAKWSRRLWADIPRELAVLTDVAKRLAKLPQAVRKNVAGLALKQPGDALSGSAAELLAAIKRCIEGPFGEQLLAKLQAIHSASEEKARKAAGAEVD
jgi:hypothetical protein